LAVLVLVLAPLLTAASGCSSLKNLYGPPPPPSVGPLSLIPPDFHYERPQGKGSSHSQLFTLTNPPTNDGPAIITDVGTSGPPFLIDVNDCAGRTLAVGAHCQIGVKFAPTAPGRQTGTLAITDNASNSPQIATLEGIGR
jgi:HYDIN/CFA65/VesB-like, Ig-like domain